jgi:tRNA1(Val) A37 N6-methylase TrmN6
MNSELLVPVGLPGFSFQVFQPKSGQTVTQDTQFLLDALLNRVSDQPLHVLELGSGTGIFPILLKLHRPNWHITGIEIQHQLIELSHLNAANCNVQIQFIEGDIRKISEFIPECSYDLILGNPPFFKMGEFRLNANTEKAISRHELLCNMDDILTAITKTVKRSGRAFLIYPTNRIIEMKEKIKNIDLQFIAEFSLSTMNNNIINKTVIVELAYADH